MDFKDSIYSQDIIELILQIDAWEISPEDFPRVFSEQYLGDFSELPQHSPYASLRFWYGGILMPRNLVCIKRELEEAVARIPGKPEDALEEYSRWEETSAAINDALAYQEFVTPDDVQLLELHLLTLCELNALELNVVLDFEG
jgi:hypothetical protein